MLTVFTCITGGFNDSLQRLNIPPDPQGRPVEFVCFTDYLGVRHPEGKSRWTIRAPIWEHDTSPRRTARWHKILSHEALPHSHYSLWHDASHTLLANPWTLVDRYLQDADLASFRHPQRHCLYQELEACLRLRKDDPKLMKDQVEGYRMLGYPANHGLLETTVLLRRHTPEIRVFNEAWWRQIVAGSMRDQLSVNFVLWERRLNVCYINGNREKSPYFAFRPHR